MAAFGGNKNDSEDSVSSKKILGYKKALNVTGNKPINKAYLNTLYSLFSVEQVISLENLYLELKEKLDKLNITGEGFMKYAKDSYKRYQEYKKIDAFQPMDKKAQEYVENFLRKTIKNALNASKGSQRE